VTRVIETSINAREQFGEDLYHSALFYLPEEAAPGLTEFTADGALTALQQWQERGIMPYERTATHLGINRPGGRIALTAVFSILRPHNKLQWTIRVAVHGDVAHVFGRYFQLETALAHFPSDANADPLVRDDMDTTSLAALRHFLWLNDALSSIKYSAVENRISRPESRRTGMPRTSWTIHLRSPRSAAPSMREQFAEVVRAAHAVRGHLRTNHRTGEKSIRVRPHIRGRGDAVQLKDYAFPAGAKQ